MKYVNYKLDMQSLPFADGTYDFVLASIVLDYIRDDDRAIKEVRRILKPNGLAMFALSLISERTIEYPEPNPHDLDRIRAPGFDYFDRFK